MKIKDSKHIRLDIIMLMITFGAQTLMEIILTVNSILSTDILYMDTVFPDIMTTAVTVIEVAAMSAALSIICAVLFMGIKILPFLLIYSGSVIYRRLLAVLITLLIGDLALDDLFMSLLVIILDIILLCIAVFIAKLLAKKYRLSHATAERDSALFTDGALKTDVDPVYPFTKLFKWSNLLQRALLWMGILLSSAKLITRTVGIITYQNQDIIMTVAGYGCDLIIVIISYAVSCLALSVLYSQNEKKRAMRVLYGEDQPNSF